jgi:hypothetical protein
MKPVKYLPFRKVAENELDRCFTDLDASVRNDLAVSLVRQWLTNGGHAGIITPVHQCWFRLVTNGDRLEVGFSHEDGTWGEVLANDWGLDQVETLALLHRLNLCQSALYRLADGRTIRISIDAKERSVQCQEVTGEDE